MKKLSVLLSVLMVVLLFAGCDLFDRDDDVVPPPSSSVNQPAGDTANDVASDVQSNTSSPAITADRAKQIAFERAGLTADQVAYVEVEYDYDDDWRGWEYSVEFRAGDYEYDCDINAETGEVIKFEKDKDLF